MNTGDTGGISRRDFVAKTTLIGASLAVGNLSWAASSAQSDEINNHKEKSKMKKRKLGKLKVSELGGGCMSISANYGPPADRNQGIKTIR